MASLSSSALTELIYPYSKIRKNFGRQPRFLEDRRRIHAHIKPSKTFRKRFRRIRLLDKRVQAIKATAATPINTIRLLRVDNGVTHVEGGWPKDIDYNEPDLVIRQRKKLEKEENFQLSMPIMFKAMQKNIRDNNAIELYQEHFPRKWVSKDKQKVCPKAVTVSILPDGGKQKRPIRKIDWAPNLGGRMVIAHLPREFSPHLRTDSANCYIWDLENATQPESIIHSDGQVTDVHFNPKDYYSIVGSCFDGTVQFWDTRAQTDIIACSPCGISHSKPAMNCSWINSKTNSQLMSVGLDGQVIWWDIRNLNEVLDQTWLDPEKGMCREEMALAGTVLEYEFTLPTKFICGTFDGNAMFMMKKGKTPQDRLIISYKAHIGPVHALKRNPMFIKNVLTVGDSTFRVFGEDCKASAVMWSQPKEELYTHGAWVPSRPSVFGCTRDDGRVEMWDLLRNPARNYYMMKVCKTRLTHFSPGINPSQFAAVGTDTGDVYIQKMSIALSTFEKHDKPKLAAVFERESHKEKNIEQRHREIRLRKRDQDKKVALQEKINKEREDFKNEVKSKAKAEGAKLSVNAFPVFKKGRNYDVAFEAKHNEQSTFERQFFADLETELREKNLDAWEEFKEIEEEESPAELTEADLEVTASDLALGAHDEEEGEEEERRESNAKAPAPATSGGEHESAEEGDDEAEEGMTRQQYNYPPAPDAPPTDTNAFPPPPGEPPNNTEHSQPPDTQQGPPPNDEQPPGNE